MAARDMGSRADDARADDARDVDARRDADATTDATRRNTPRE